MIWQVQVGTEGGEWHELDLVPDCPGRFAGEVVTPRATFCQLQCTMEEHVAGSGCNAVGRAAAAGAGVVPLLRFRVRPQVQDIIEVPDPSPLPEVDCSGAEALR